MKNSIFALSLFLFVERGFTLSESAELPDSVIENEQAAEEVSNRDSYEESIIAEKSCPTYLLEDPSLIPPSDSSFTLDSHPSANDENLPWFTGPLLTPSGHVVPAGYINVEPYLFVNVTTGLYNKHWHAKKTPKFYNINFQLPIQIGITKWMDFSFNPQASYNRFKKKSSYVINDLSANLDFQVYQDSTNTYPDIKFYIQETFPIGRYQRLKADKLGTDAGGEGSFVTGLGLVFTNTYHIYCEHYLAWRANVFYNFPTSVHVHGLNAYGGASNTKGKVCPGQSWGGLFGLEYSLTKNWVLAFDAYGIYKNKTRFSGRAGTNPDGTPATVGLPSSVQFSLAPAIEYNFNESLGIIAGSWFSLAGRNSSRFISGVIALNYFGPIGKGAKAEYTDIDSGGGGHP